MKRLIVVSGLVAIAVAALLAMRAGAQVQEPQRGQAGRVEYGFLIEGLAGENKVCWVTSDGNLAARDWIALNERLGGQKASASPQNAVFNALGTVGWQLVLAEKPRAGDTGWVFSRPMR